MGVSVKDLPAALRKQVMAKLNEIEGQKGGKPPTPTENKLHAEKCGEYDSKKEARRALELKMLQRAGKISDLQEQVKFVLIPPKYEEIPRIGKRGKPIKPKRVCIERGLSYVADFVYIDNATGHTVVEDVKGYKGGATYQLFVHKRKLMLEIYGIRVKEV